MILAVDIGNTNITLGGFDKEELVFTARISTDMGKTEDEYAGAILSALVIHGAKREELSGSIISSVVPPLNSVMKKALKFVTGYEPLVVGPGIKTGINIHCDTPSSVGSDIICACVAVSKLYGAPALIIDMGTSTNMIALDKSSTFIGVSIIPGVSMGMRALSASAAQLPEIDLAKPSAIIAKNTVDCMRSGVVYGNACLIDGMIDRICEELGEQPPIYATGAHASLICSYCRHSIMLDENLVLKGLNLLYIKNQRY